MSNFFCILNMVSTHLMEKYFISNWGRLGSHWMHNVTVRCSYSLNVLKELWMELDCYLVI